jgi:hypothetical protein
MKTQREIEKEFDEKFQEEFIPRGNTPSPKGTQRVCASAYPLRESIKSFIRQLRQDDIKSLIDVVEKSFKEWFSKDWKATKYQADYPDNPLEDFMKIVQSQLKD